MIGNMIGKLLLIGAFAATAMLAAPGTLASSVATTAPGQKEGISLALGERDFRNYCAACHGVDAVGDGTLGEFLTLTVPDLTKLTKRNTGVFPEERVRQVIDGRAEVRIHGARDMPIWGDWFDREAEQTGITNEARDEIVHDRIESLMLYLKSIQVN
jgi:mono/diheme cytochrome c family protein